MVATSTKLESAAHDPETETFYISTNKTMSITTRLRELILVSSAIALVLAYLAFVGYDLMTRPKYA